MGHVDLDESVLRRLIEIDASRIAFLASYINASDPNPFVLRRFGEAIAFRHAGHARAGLFNRVLGFQARDLPLLEPIVTFYEEVGVPCQIDLTPTQAVPELLDALQQRGFRNVGVSSVFRCEPEPAPRTATGIEIAQASGPGLREVISLHRSFAEQPPFDESEIDRRCAFLAAHPEYRMFIASIEGAASAVAALLFFPDGACHFANAITDPARRRRGCQRALLEHRLDVAARAGSRLAVTDTLFGGTSHRNTERAGFRLAYVNAWWVLPNGKAPA